METELHKCCECGDAFDVGFKMGEDEYVCADHYCCYNYCKYACIDKVYQRGQEDGE